MKTIHYIIIALAGAFIIVLLLINAQIFQVLPHNPKIVGDDVTALTNNAIPNQYKFSQQIGWHIYISADGKIQPISGDGKIDRNLQFSCSFSVIPNDGHDHFVYLSVSRNNETGYVVAIDDQNGQVIQSKSVSLESAVCGP
jgi:hypothetical protein